MNTEHYKEKLETEKQTLEAQLQSIAQPSEETPGDWEAKGAGLDVDAADQNERADAVEEYETNIATLKDLELRYREVKDALERINTATYGTCSVCGETISEERLLANPAASTCSAHMNE
ncbi:MAG: TraR/DksA C4-type zinc finger protein [Candidatus Pacebacteria bacterium]|nr:TraR/DksA C4-type zinc finger protein [Candidatus Paceibacterota bacterium]